MNEYWEIDGNKWSKSIYSEDEAKALAKTLVECSNCVDCSDCSYCSDCSGCSGFDHQPQQFMTP